MHHFLYPTKDTFITNRGDYDNKNFGVDEILKVGTKNTATKVWRNTKEYSYNNSYVSNLHVDAFFGTASVASFAGTSRYVSGSVFQSGSIMSITVDYFSGSVVGELAGTETGSPILSYDFSGSLTSFSGNILTFISASHPPYGDTSSWDNVSIQWDYWKSLWDWDVVVGLGGAISGVVSGSFTASCFGFFTWNGTMQDLYGTIYYGFITGKDTRQERNLLSTTTKYPNRALMQFNVSSISTSIASGEIATPDFNLNLHIAKEEELSIAYSVYAFPVNQSWDMGNGYYYDGGSETGCSWMYRDYDEGALWYPMNSTTASLGVIDFITHPEQASESWVRGGGTWCTNSAYFCSQSFDYATSDVVMDLNRIVHAWLSGTISNCGIILLSSDEFASTGSQFDLSFFSKDTNTVYYPYLDAGWNDVEWSTGSVTLASQTFYASSGSVSWTIVNGYLLSGSTDLVTGSNGINISSSLSGTFGLCGPAVISGDPGTISGEVTAVAKSGPFIGSTITGDVFGSYSGSIISGSFSSGLLTGCGFTGSSIAIWTGYASGSSFVATASGSYILSGSTIVGTTDSTTVVVASLSGYVVAGSITGSYITSGQFLGMIQNGWAAGYYVSASVSGSYNTSSAATASVYTSNSLDAMQTNQPFAIVVQNVPQIVKANNIIRVNVFGREEFPLKSFKRATQLTQFITPKYLPTSSYYALKDNETEQIVVDFDNYTKISCDENGNYFLIDTSCLPQERYFRILIKVEQSGSIYTVDHGNVFKVVR